MARLLKKIFFFLRLSFKNDVIFQQYKAGQEIRRDHPKVTLSKKIRVLLTGEHVNKNFLFSSKEDRRNRFRIFTESCY